ncbi:hypothetical protein GO737_04450, partial [Staphylococcus aureus]|nr:hypothetical protein [Staphylococcus aureus]
MPNNNSQTDKYEEAYRLRRNVVTSVLLVIAVIVCIFAYQQHADGREIQSRGDRRMGQSNKVKKEV